MNWKPAYFQRRSHDEAQDQVDQDRRDGAYCNHTLFQTGGACGAVEYSCGATTSPRVPERETTRGIIPKIEPTRSRGMDGVGERPAKQY